MKDIYIMGIESSCDETSVAIVKNGREVLSNVINSQIAIHEKYGGVVPEIASRCHVEVINGIMKGMNKMMVGLGIFILILFGSHAIVEYLTGGYNNENEDCKIHWKINRHDESDDDIISDN